MAAQDLGAQAALQQQINEILTARVKINSDIETSYSRQLKIIVQMKEALGGSAKALDDAKKSLTEQAAAQDQVTEATDKAKKSQQDLTATITQAADEAEKLQKRLNSVSKVSGMFGDALAGAATGTWGLIKAAGNLVGTLFNVGKAILTLPLKLWSAFVDLANESGGGGNAIAQAYEEVRKQFGDIASGSGKQVIDMYKNLRDSGAEAAKMGRSLGQIFGPGPEGQAAMIKFTAEMAGSLGSQMGEVFQQIGKDMVNVTFAIKGMGLSNEEAGKAMGFFYNSGQNASKMMQDMGKTAAMLADKTGFNIKTLGKAMVETTQAFPQFAKKGVEAMAKVADYTHRLGISVKSLQATFDAFDSFDAAAESASQLSQAFGVNIDAMKMVKEQDPTKRMEALRDAFKQTGKSLNDLSSAERKQLLTSMHLSEEDAERVLGEGNKKKALSESEKAAQAATKAAQHQTVAMEKLAKAIEKVIPSGGGAYKGFWDAFTSGFGAGAKQSHNLRTAMAALRRSFHQVYLFGRQLGRLFFDHFPGITKMAQGFKKIFDPRVFARFRHETIKIFKDLFKDLEGGDPKASFNKFFDRIKDMFKRVFGTGTGSGLALMKEGFQKFTGILGALMGQVVAKLIQMMTEGLKNLTELITNPQKVINAAQGAVGFVANFFAPIKDAMAQFGPALGDALIALLKAAWTKAQPFVEKIAKALGMFFAIKFAISLALALAKELVVAGVKALVTKALAPSAADASGAAGKAAAVVRRGSKQAQAVDGAVSPAAAATGAKQPGMIKGLKENIKNLASIKATDILKATGIVLLLAAMISGGIVLLALSVRMMMAIVTPTELIAGMVGIAIAAGAIMMMGKAVQQLGKVKINEIRKGMQSAAVLILAIPLLGAAILATSFMIKGIPAIPTSKFKSFGLIVLLAFPTVGLAFYAASKIETKNLGNTIKGLAAMILVMPLLSLAVLISAALISAMPELSVGQILKFALLTAILMVAAGAAILASIVLGAMLSGPQLAIAAIGLGALLVTMPLISLAVMFSALAIKASGFDKISIVDIFKFAFLTTFLFTTASTLIVVAAGIGLLVIATLPFIIAGMAALTLAITAIIGIVSVAGKAINESMKDVSLLNIISFGILTALLFSTATVLLPVAAAMGVLSILAAPFILAGMVALGLAIAAIVKLTSWTVGQLKNIGSPTQIIAVALALSLFGGFMFAVAALIPLAANLGVMALSFFGAGALLIVAGFALLSKVITSMVSTVAKIIEVVEKMKIGDPTQFKAKVEAFSAIMSVVSKTVDSFTGLFKALNPGSISNLLTGGGAFEKVLQAANKVIQSITQPLLRFTVMIKKIAESEDITKEGLEATKAIAIVLEAASGLMKNFSPSDAAMKAVNTAVDEWVNASGLTDKVLGGIDKFAQTMGKNLVDLIDHLATFITTISTSLADKDFSDSAPLVSALGDMMKGIAPLMSAMQPNDAIMKTVRTAVEQNIGAEDLTKAVFEGVNSFTKNMTANLIGEGGDGLISRSITFFEKLKAALPTNINFSEESIEMSKTMSGIISAMSELMKGMDVSDKEAELVEKAQKAEKWGNSAGPAMAKALESMSSSKAGSITSIVEGVGTLITTMSTALSGKDFTNIGPMASMISSAISGAAQLMSVMSLTGPEAAAVSKGQEEEGKDSKVIEQLSTRMTQMKDILTSVPDGLLPTIGSVIEGIVGSVQPLIDKIAEGGVSSESLKALNSILTTVGGMMSDLMKAGIGMAEQLLKAEDPAPLKDAISEIFTSMGSFLMTIGPALAIAINGVLDIAKGLPDDAKKTILPKVEVLNKSMEAMVEVAKMFSPSGALGGTTETKIARGQPKVIQSTVEAMIDTMDAFVKAMFQGEGAGLMTKFINGILSLPVKGLDATKSKQLKFALDAAKQVVDMLSKMAPPSGEKKGEGFKAVFEENGPLALVTKAMEVGGNFRKFLQAMTDAGMAKLLKDMAPIPFKAAAASMENIIKMFDELGKMGEKAKDKSFKSGIEALGEEPFATQLAGLFKPTGMLASLAKTFTGGVAADFVRAGPNLSKASAGMSSFAESLDGFISAYALIARKMPKDFNEATGNSFLTHMKDVVVTLHATADAIGKEINSLKVDPKTTDFVVALNDIKGGHVTVSHNLPNLKFDVHIDLDAKEIARSLTTVTYYDHGGARHLEWKPGAASTAGK